MRLGINAVLLFFFVGCGVSESKKDSVPNIEMIFAEPEIVQPKETTELFVVATHPDGEPLNYLWSAGGYGSWDTGMFGNVDERNGPRAKWRSPDNSGQYWITCYVDDGVTMVSDSVLVSVVVQQSANSDKIVE